MTYYSVVYIYSAKPSLVSCFFYHFKLELAQLLRFNYLSTSYLFKRLFLRSLQPLYDLFYLFSYFSNSSYFHWNSPSFGTDLLGIYWSLSIFFFNFRLEFFPYIWMILNPPTFSKFILAFLYWLNCQFLNLWKH